MFPNLTLNSITKPRSNFSVTRLFATLVFFLHKTIPQTPGNLVFKNEYLGEFETILEFEKWVINLVDTDLFSLF
jgi:hypothetical protein